MKYFFSSLLLIFLFVIPLKTLACHQNGPIGFAKNDPGMLTADVTSFPTYSSGSTSGTSGCKNWDFVHFRHQAQSDYLIAEWDYLVEEAASGEGGHVTALARLMGCPAEEDHAFGSLLKINYISLFEHPPKQSENSKTFLVTLGKLMIQQQVLGKRCRIAMKL